MDELLLRDLSMILNAYQDIEDALEKGTVDLEKVRGANTRIGSIVKNLLPE